MADHPAHEDAAGTGGAAAKPAASHRQRSVTLHDVARATGFSANTVSHALKDKPDISAATKELIRKAAAELGYIVNVSASSLRSGHSRTVAIILGDLSNPHFAIMIKQIEADIRRLGYTAIVLNTDEDPALEKQAMITALSQKAAGVFLCPTQDTAGNVRFLQQSGTPFVLLGRYFDNFPADAVLADDRQGGFLAARHLLELGHRRILFLNGPTCISSAVDRLAGYYQALQDYQIPFDPDLVQTISITAGKNLAGKKQILLARQDYTAVLAFSDLIALEAIDILNENGRRVPEDVSVIGFDNIQSQFMLPTHLTSISTAKSALASRAVELLISRIEQPDPSAKPVQIVLPARLVQRQTAQRLRQ